MQRSLRHLFAIKDDVLYVTASPAWSTASRQKARRDGIAESSTSPDDMFAPIVGACPLIADGKEIGERDGDVWWWFVARPEHKEAPIVSDQHGQLACTHRALPP